MKHLYSYEFNSARNALRVLIREFNIFQIHIPYYLCPVIRNALKKENCEVRFYHIDESFFPSVDFEPGDFILYPNYFGICSENVKSLNAKYKNLIVDNAHSFYSKHFGFASFNSYRKFFFYNYGLKDGSCLTICKPLNLMFDEDTSLYNPIKNNFSYDSILQNEKRVDEFEILTISNTSEKIIRTIDFQKDKQLRLKSFFELHKQYESSNELKIELKDGEVPLVYPLLTHDEALQKKISSENELVFRYWTKIPESFPEYNFYKNLLPIPLTSV